MRHSLSDILAIFTENLTREQAKELIEQLSKVDTNRPFPTLMRQLRARMIVDEKGCIVAPKARPKYDDLENWSEKCRTLHDAYEYAVGAWGKLPGSAIWPQKDGTFRICDGYHAEEGRNLLEIDLPEGAYFYGRRHTVRT